MTEETADLLYHLLVLLKSRGLKLQDAVEVLRDRHGRHPERSEGSLP